MSDSNSTKQAVIKITIDRQEALSGLQETESRLRQLKDQQKELTSEYNKGKITVDEYSRSKVNLDQQIKNETQSRKILQQAVMAETNSMNAQKAELAKLIQQRNAFDQSTKHGVESVEKLNIKIKELNDSLKSQEAAGGNFQRNVGNYSEGFKGFAEHVKVGEVELGSFARAAESIVSPVGLAAGAVTALGAAYLNSAAGAKDFEAASQNLKATWDIISNQIGGTKEEGGFFQGFSEMISTVSLSIAGIRNNLDDQRKAQGELLQKQHESEKALRRLRFLDEEGLRFQREAVEKQFEARKLVEQRDNLELSIYERQKAAVKIVEDLNKHTDILKAYTETVLEETQKLGVATGKIVDGEIIDVNLKKQIYGLQLQILQIDNETQRKKSQAVLAEQRITQEIKKQNELKKQNTAASKPGKEYNEEDEMERIKKSEMAELNKAQAEANAEERQFQDDAYNMMKEYLQKTKELRSEDVQDQQNTDLAKQKSISATIGIIGAAQTLATLADKKNKDIYKATSTASAIISTYAAADKVLSAFSTIPIPGYAIAEAAATIAAGLANVAKINAAAGGGSFMTKGPTMLMVGDNPGGVERIDVTPISGRGQTRVNGNTVAMAGGGSLQMISDGGLFTNNSSKDVDTARIFSNAISKMPAPVVSWKEGIITGKRLEFKEGLTSK